MYECFHCGEKAVIWDSDYNPEDIGIEGNGVVHMCHCTNCKAEIQYIIMEDEDE